MRWRETFDLPKRWTARFPPILAELSVAVGVTCVAAGIRYCLEFYVHDVATFPLAFPTIALATLIAGWRSGLYVIILYQAFAGFILPQPRDSFSSGRLSDAISLGLILTAQAMLVWFAAIYRKYAGNLADLERRNAIKLRTARDALARQQELETELRARYLELQSAQQRLQAIYDASSEGVMLCRVIRSAEGAVIDYRVLELNRAHFELTGHSREKMLASPVSQIAPPIDPRWCESAEMALRTGELQQFDFFSPTTRRWLNIRVSPIADDLFQQTFVDVGDRYRLDEQRQSLLKEMSHRVLNNFQMIASFLNLQSGDAKPEVKQQLDIAKNRIQVIARLHSLLAYSTTETEVDVGNYLRELCVQLAQTIDRPASVRLVCQCTSLLLNPDVVIPLGLVTSELVVNAIKYAFPDKRAGEIRVIFAKAADGAYVLEVSDDGVGFGAQLADEPPKPTRSGLGMRLVQIFVRQLKGELVTTSTGGVRHVLNFAP